MYITCLDVEGVLVPEIWVAFAEASGIPELKRTTRDEPDYNKLMRWRLDTLKAHGLGIKEIQEIIPHRHPFLLVDCIEELEPGVRAVGYKSVTYNEPYFAGHFPQEPVMPGVLIVEALAQTGAVAILSVEENKGKTAYFGAMNNVKFKKKVVPGDKLRLECEIIKQKGPVGIGKAVATVDGKVAVSAELTFMIG